jgi:hypothetical protein
MLFYSDGGPGPATKLYRVDSPTDGNMAGWACAPAQSWQPDSGWRPNDHVQDDILWLGEFTMVDASEVEQVQWQILDDYMQFETKG